MSWFKKVGRNLPNAENCPGCDITVTNAELSAGRIPLQDKYCLKNESAIISCVSTCLTYTFFSGVYLYLLLTSQNMEVSGDTRAPPTFRNKSSGTNRKAEYAGDVDCVDILYKRYICCKFSSQ